MKWFKTLTTIHRIPKVRRLKEGDRWRYVACLSVAGDRDSENGELPSIPDLAIHLGVQERSLRVTCGHMVEVGLCAWDIDKDHIIILQWAEHQFTGKYRQKRYRDTKKADSDTPLRNANVTPSNGDALEEKRRDLDKSKKREEKGIYVEVKDSWNAFASDLGLAEVRKLTDKRRKAVKIRHAEVWPEIDTIYQKIKASDFLRGVKGGWTVDFDFLWCRTDGATLILEGKYDDRKTNNGTSGKDAGQYEGIGSEFEFTR